MDTRQRADAIVADRLRQAAAREPLPGRAHGRTAVDIARAIAADTPHAERFTTEVAAAVTGTAHALTAARPHPAPDRLWAHAAAHHPDPTVWFEQAIVLGHPTHPLARLRGTLTDTETRRYAPEHAPRLYLGLHRPKLLHSSPHWPVLYRGGPLLPVHPWQAARHHLPNPPIRVEATPLMSLRTLSTGTHHFKCAIDLQLTSAVRHVSPAAVDNGPAITARLTRPARDAGIILMPETAAAALGDDAQPLPHLAAIARPAPHRLAGPHIVPTAALAEPCPATGRPIAAALAPDHLDQWWHHLTAHLIGAPLRLYAATGVALEAHGQNTLIAFTDNTPTHLLYRDLGGIRVPDTWPQISGDLPTPDEPERIRKLLAALLPTTTTALVNALATWTDTDPGQWWRDVAHAARDATRDHPALAAAVLRDPWPTKATTAMRLADDPIADQWTHVDNPLTEQP